MSQTGSYKIQSIAKIPELEIKRLNAQVDLFWEKELQHYIQFGFQDNSSIIEFGSGPGYVTEKILTTFPHSYVTGVEIDPYLVEIAKNYLAQSNIDSEHYNVMEGSIVKTSFPDDTFDFAVIRLVLEHVPNALHAVKEVCRILKPGGKAFFVDNDFEMHLKTFPHIPELRLLYEAYCKSRFSEGGNPLIGRELPSYLQKGGFSNIDFEFISAHSKILGDQVFLESEGLGIPTQLVQDGFLDSKVLASIALKWRKMMQSEDHLIVRQLSLCVGEKVI